MAIEHSPVALKVTGLRQLVGGKSSFCLPNSEWVSSFLQNCMGKVKAIQVGSLTAAAPDAYLF